MKAKHDIATLEKKKTKIDFELMNELELQWRQTKSEYLIKKINKISAQYGWYEYLDENGTLRLKKGGLDLKIYKWRHTMKYTIELDEEEVEELAGIMEDKIEEIYNFDYDEDNEEDKQYMDLLESIQNKIIKQ